MNPLTVFLIVFGIMVYRTLAIGFHCQPSNCMRTNGAITSIPTDRSKTLNS
jgi:hypothetical protein